MARLTIGVLAARRIWLAGVRENKLAGPVRVHPDSETDWDGLERMNPGDLVESIARQIALEVAGGEVGAIGTAFPGIVRDGVVEDSPNLAQLKGVALAAQLTARLAQAGIHVPVTVLNDADAMAVGIAATSGRLDSLIRLWYLGEGVGFGRHPRGEGVWEGGHVVVSLDPKERYCGCGGHGHLEGITGRRAMRLRFLDLEPDEVFENAHEGDSRCAEFVNLWHRALAAASATSIHLDGPGRFFLAGPSARYVDVDLLNVYLHEMVRMSPLQGSFFEVIPTSEDLAIIGAARAAERAAEQA